MNREIITEAIMFFGSFSIFMFVLYIGCIITDYGLPHIKPFRQWFNPVPDHKNGEEEENLEGSLKATRIRTKKMKKEEIRMYKRNWKPSKTAIKEYVVKMNKIAEFCSKNLIFQSRSGDSYYFAVDGQNYRVSNHSVESSNTHSKGKYHSGGRLEEVIYIHAGKTRIIDIYNDLKAGYKIDARGNRIS